MGRPDVGRPVGLRQAAAYFLVLMVMAFGLASSTLGRLDGFPTHRGIPGINLAHVQLSDDVHDKARHAEGGSAATLPPDGSSDSRWRRSQRF